MVELKAISMTIKVQLPLEHLHFVGLPVLMNSFFKISKCNIFKFSEDSLLFSGLVKTVKGQALFISFLFFSFLLFFPISLIILQMIIKMRFRGKIITVKHSLFFTKM